jgi:uncharacterized protein YdgA (DUF945 family)
MMSETCESENGKLQSQFPYSSNAVKSDGQKMRIYRYRPER